MATPSNRERQGNVQQESGPASGVEEATDPICGMRVELQDAHTEHAQHHGRRYYFCSPDCREQFEASPDDFVD